MKRANKVRSKQHIFILLGLSLLFSLFFSLFQMNATPPCFNADEAAFGYNAYSLLTTGADEYGNTLPVRLKSFGDYKLPLYSYLSIPFIGMFGLNEVSARMVNILLALVFPIIMFLFVRQVTKNDSIAAVSSILVSVSLGLGVVHRHAHEAYLAVSLITLSCYFFIKFLDTQYLRHGLFFISTLFLSLFAYQSSRIYALFFFVFALGYFVSKRKLRKNSIFFAVFVIAVALFAYTDIVYKPARVEKLFLTNDQGFQLKKTELLGEGGNKFAYNNFTLGAQDVLARELQFFSPQFLAINGDENFRFGFPGMSPMTFVEYLFIFVGLYYLFKNNERWRFFLVGLLLVAPLTGALTWNEGSLTRSLFLIVPLLLLSAYGIYHLLVQFKERRIFVWLVSLLIFAECILLFYSWNFYFNHYPKRAMVVRSWQCGYKEVAEYIKSEYKNVNKFYITKKNGEPYIFLLFYLNFPAKEYQKQAHLTAPDEYGFGQVESFDKYIFSVPGNAFKEKNVVIIGYPDDFDFNELSNVDKSKIKKIKVGTEDIFLIYKT